MTRGVVSIEVHEPKRLIRATLVGLLTDVLLGECFELVRASHGFQSGYSVLLDLSLVTKTQLSSQAVVTYGQTGRTDKNRIAIVAKDITAFGMGRMYETIADPTERRVRVFKNEEFAMEWIAIEASVRQSIRTC